MYKMVKTGEQYNIPAYEIWCDEESDVALIPLQETPTFSIAYITATQNIYVLNTKKQWVKQ